MTQGSIHTVAIPGLCCSARLYEPVLPNLWTHGAVTIADTRRDRSLRGIAERLLSDAPSRFALAGISMGGYVALEVMRHAPERVLAIALISTSARADAPDQAAARRVLLARVKAGGFEEVVSSAFPVLVDPRNRENTDLAAFWNDMAHEVGPAVFSRQLRAVVERGDSRRVLPQIACPAAVIHGAGDRLIPVEHGEEMAEAIGGAAFTVVEGGGHMVMQEQSNVVSAALDSLLERAASSA